MHLSLFMLEFWSKTSYDEECMELHQSCSNLVNYVMCDVTSHCEVLLNALAVKVCA